MSNTRKLCWLQQSPVLTASTVQEGHIKTHICDGQPSKLHPLMHNRAPGWRAALVRVLVAAGNACCSSSSRSSSSSSRNVAIAALHTAALQDWLLVWVGTLLPAVTCTAAVVIQPPCGLPPQTGPPQPHIYHRPSCSNCGIDCFNTAKQTLSSPNPLVHTYMSGIYIVSCMRTPKRVADVSHLVCMQMGFDLRLSTKQLLIIRLLSMVLLQHIAQHRAYATSPVAHKASRRQRTLPEAATNTHVVNSTTGTSHLMQRQIALLPVDPRAVGSWLLLLLLMALDEAGRTMAPVACPTHKQNPKP